MCGFQSMSLKYASDHLVGAVEALASSELPLQERLQLAWDEHVQMVWMKPCLTAELLREFRDFWRRYTAPSDDRTSTKLRELSRVERKSAISELVALSSRVTNLASSTSDQALATLADLG